MKELGNQFWQLCTRPISKFLEEGVLGGLLLVFAAVCAIIWANSPANHLYESLLHQNVTFGIGPLAFEATFHHFVNDGLMAIFFFVVGLEIKRELLVGELSETKKALLPAVAAVGGMVFPALIYVLFNLQGDFISGWGVPMATDIAFALGVMALLGNRVPLALKVFLLALAIFDDMGAILVIAIFYGDQINLYNLLIAGILLAISILLNIKGVRKPLPYALIGLFLWFALLNSGIHATIAGVLLALTIPARSKMDNISFKKHTGELIRTFPEAPVQIMVTDENQREFMKRIHCSVDDLDSPLQKLEDMLHGFSSFVILPIFALANAGVHLSGEGGTLQVLHPVFLGIFAGLVLGKPLGIFIVVYLSSRIGLTKLPEQVEMKHILGIGCLAGIGFTMSIFVTNLAFADASVINQAKIAILTASIVSSILGIFLLRHFYKRQWEYLKKLEELGTKEGGA